jgi:hypothetical protein
MSPIMSWPIPSSHFLRRTESSTEDTEQVSSTGVNHKRFISIKLSPDRHLDALSPDVSEVMNAEGLLLALDIGRQCQLTFDMCSDP